MQELNCQDVETVSGAGLWSYFARKLVDIAIIQTGEAVIAGQVDYAGVAESQGSYYNTVGA